MQVNEIRVQLEMLVMKRRADKPIYYLTEEGDVYEVQNIVYDPENECVFMSGVLKDE